MTAPRDITIWLQDIQDASREALRRLPRNPLASALPL